MSNKYPDLDGTKFPNQIDDFEKFIDPNIDMVDKIAEYQRYFDNKDLANAENLLEQNPSLKRMIINAENLNKLRDMNIAVQRLFFEDIQQYLVDIVTPKGEYNPTVKYLKYDVVTFFINEAIQAYMGISNNIPIGTLPTDINYFVSITLQGPKGESGIGLSYRGNYSSTVQYYTNDCVSYNNVIWAAKNNNIGRLPSELSDSWLLALAINSKIPVSETRPFDISYNDLWFQEIV